MLIDSNIIIYASKPEYANLRQFIAEHGPVVSAVSDVEVLGFHRLLEEEKTLLEAFFAATTILALTQAILDQAVALRQQRRMSLGDALVASTALVHNHTLVTHNVNDFRWIDGLAVFDPLAVEDGSTN
jgi:predicted nucleic acid-binding protein